MYTDAAIKCVLTLRAVYHLALRATEGLACSLVAVVEVALPVPSYGTLSRRAAEVVVDLGALPRSGPLHLVSDSHGFKVYGEGEGKVRLHGWGKRRTWRKLHRAVDEAPGESVAAVASEAGVSDEEALADLLTQMPGEVGHVSADGASDTRCRYKVIEQRQAKAVIPPRRDAKIWQQGRRLWKKEARCHRRSLAETALFRFKTIFGPTLQAREFRQQATELFIKTAALKWMTHLGMPQSSRLAA